MAKWLAPIAQALAGSWPQFFSDLAERLFGSCLALPSCARCRLQYAATLRMWLTSSCSYLDASLSGFFLSISMILRPLQESCQHQELDARGLLPLMAHRLAVFLAPARILGALPGEPFL